MTKILCNVCGDTDALYYWCPACFYSQVELSSSILNANLQISASLASQLNTKLEQSQLLEQWQSLRDTKRRIRAMKLEIQHRAQSVELLRNKVNSLRSVYQKCVSTYSVSLEQLKERQEDIQDQDLLQMSRFEKDNASNLCLSKLSEHRQFPRIHALRHIAGFFQVTWFRDQSLDPFIFVNLKSENDGFLLEYQEKGLFDRGSPQLNKALSQGVTQEEQKQIPKPFKSFAKQMAESALSFTEAGVQEEELTQLKQGMTVVVQKGVQSQKKSEMQSGGVFASLLVKLDESLLSKKAERKLKLILTQLQICNVFLKVLGQIHSLYVPFEVSSLLGEIFEIVHYREREEGYDQRLETKIGQLAFQLNQNLRFLTFNLGGSVMRFVEQKSFLAIESLLVSSALKKQERVKCRGATVGSIHENKEEEFMKVELKEKHF